MFVYECLYPLGKYRKRQHKYAIAGSNPFKSTSYHLIVIIGLRTLKLAALEHQQGACQWHDHPQQHGADQ